MEWLNNLDNILDRALSPKLHKGDGERVEDERFGRWRTDGMSLSPASRRRNTIPGDSCEQQGSLEPDPRAARSSSSHVTGVGIAMLSVSKENVETGSFTSDDNPYDGFYDEGWNDATDGSVDFGKLTSDPDSTKPTEKSSFEASVEEWSLAMEKEVDQFTESLSTPPKNNSTSQLLAEFSDSRQKSRGKDDLAEQSAFSESSIAPDQRSFDKAVTFKRASDNRRSELFTEDLDDSSGSEELPDHIRIEKNSPRFLQVWDDGQTEQFDPKMNCFGVVHVRILRAQRLPCPVGSRVQAVVSLPPWKGRVRSERTSAFIGSVDRGVCVHWDQFSDAGLCSMVHPWSGEDTPVPCISISLVFTPVALIEFTVCKLSLSCDTLMRTPNVWKRVFCETTSASDKKNDNRMQYTVTDRAPLIELEAMFKPVQISNEKHNEVAVVGNAIPETSQAPKREVEKSTDSVISNQLELSSSTPHLLRVQSHFTPAVCCACKSLMIGWKIGFRCEECRIDCCGDCQLQVDLQIPCGSELARDAVEKAIQNKLTVANILATVAPVERSLFRDKEGVPEEKVLDTPQPLHRLQSKSGDELPSVGILKMEFKKGCIFSRALPPETEPDDVERHSRTSTLRSGDYYVRVSWTGSKKTSRTRTIQNTSKPVFDSGEMRWVVPHYATEYRIEVVDATSDNPVGAALLTAQTILQHQRDWIAEKSVLRLAAFPKRFSGKRRLVLELRAGMKAAFGLDYFNSSKSLESSGSSKGRSTPGEIVGLLEVLVCLEEAVDQLYGFHPIECPMKPPDELHMQLFQLHVGRIGALIDDLRTAADSYNYIISWKNPAHTSFSLFIFVYVCATFNAEYVASIPFLFLMIYMIYLAWIRSQGNLKNRFLRKEQESYREAEKKVAVRCAVHRPVGKIEISIAQGKNIRSKDLGLPGSVGCRVFFDPVRYLSDKKKAGVVAIESSAGTTHEVGSTDFQFTHQPLWLKLFESEECKRLKHLLPDESIFFGSKPESQSSQRPLSLQFPVLQPFTARSKELDGAGRLIHSELQPWDASPAAVVVEVRFQDLLNALGFDDALGEVCIPLSKIIENGEISGWFRVMEVGSTIVSPVDERQKEVEGHETNALNKTTSHDDQHPLILIHLKWIPPGDLHQESETDRMASLVIQEELIRSSILAQKNKIDLVGSSIGAFNTVRGLRGNVQLIQNSLGAALDVVESIRNAFNFTDPYKSSVLLIAVALIWVFLAFVPTRFLILFGGLAQFGTTFMTRYGPSLISGLDQQHYAKSEEMKQLEIRCATWLINAIRGLPTDEDLRKAYFWESKRVGERESEILSSRKRQSRLKRLWNAPWYSTVQVMERYDETRRITWENVFAIVQGRRFLWWRSARDFDSGEEPVGRIFLSGHAGLASLSPLELREIEPDEIPFVVTIFGRGMHAQQRATLLMPSVEVKESLEAAVLAASFKDD